MIYCCAPHRWCFSRRRVELDRRRRSYTLEKLLHARNRSMSSTPLGLSPSGFAAGLIGVVEDLELDDDGSRVRDDSGDDDDEKNRSGRLCRKWYKASVP
mmetsp:Transcript_21014/g.49804  ORF Transcript_21014/g.49804 Transcript_21014/m.49804 type:complete len:99 (-) Transcript_21014:1864-2160(-)